MEKQNKAKRAQSAMEYLLTYGWAILIIIIVLAALVAIGVFNQQSTVNNQCLLPNDFTCTARLYSSNSLLVINILQSTSSPVSISAIGCNNQNVLSNMVGTNPPSNVVVVPIGQNRTFDTFCYANDTLANVASGQIFKGDILVNYTDLSSNFNHTIVGQLVVRAT